MNIVDTVVDGNISTKVDEAKKKLVEFVGQVDLKLSEHFEAELESVFGASAEEKKLAYLMWSHMKEHNLRPAKRLRGSFIYYGYRLFGGQDLEMAMAASMSIELIHTGLLMHDDVMDRDVVRRGLSTTHKFFEDYHRQNGWSGDGEHYGESMAINLGDMALLSGYEILNNLKCDPLYKQRAMKKLLRGVVNTGIGQGVDVTLQVKNEAVEKDIFNLHLGKTAVYTYQTPLQVGALLAGADGDDLLTINEYAIPGGVAFQLQDDILGLFGDPEMTGKSDNSDLSQKKMTLLMVKAMEFGSDVQRGKLKQLWGKEDITEAEADICREIVIKTGSLDYSKEKAVEFAKKSLVAVERLRGMGLDKEAVDYLEGIALYMVEREI